VIFVFRGQTSSCSSCSKLAIAAGAFVCLATVTNLGEGFELIKVSYLYLLMDHSNWSIWTLRSTLKLHLIVRIKVGISNDFCSKYDKVGFYEERKKKINEFLIFKQWNAQFCELYIIDTDTYFRTISFVQCSDFLELGKRNPSDTHHSLSLLSHIALLACLSLWCHMILLSLACQSLDFA